ncbi:MAG: type I-D CRISPR-associated protein Cas10d/Csc3 [Aphanothece sp. CMT-3BRIN-NPC111]|jgi:CRISPR-associated protein Csc3|nr:type I-D CRISPR-associated protein Cas10d/Csc3 [Aphanothece sp. CMT-3BRIN-NPC111]
MIEFDDNLDELIENISSFGDIENDDADSPAKRELLTIRLFKEAIRKTNKGDRILENFAENVLPNLIKQLAGATAKGGRFFERIDARRAAEGKKPVRRDNAGDQSLVSHLLNGLFPSYRILNKLKEDKLQTNPVNRYCEELQICVFITSYILHDFEKIPDYQTWLVNNDDKQLFINRDWEVERPKKSDAPNLGRDYISKKIIEFGLNHLLGEQWQDYIDDIIWISSNAGVKNDADLGLATRGLRPLEDERLDGRVRDVLVNLVSLSDLFASVVKHPSDVESGRLPTVLQNLSNRQLKLSHHSLSDNRGVLTNILNNTLIDAHLEEFYTPLLYLPDGVVYLAVSDAPSIATDNIPNEVIAKIKSLCISQLKKRQTGFSRDGKGFKFADYYWLFFDVVELMQVSINAASRLIPETKNASAGKRSESLQSFKAKGELPENLNVEFENENRIDRLAEFGDILCRGIWNRWCDRVSEWQKQLPKAERKTPPHLDLTQHLAEHLELSEEIPAIRLIQSLKKTGGVPLDWYYLAAQYYRKNPGQSFAESLEVMEGIVNYAASLIRLIVEEFEISDGWDDLRTYVSRVISLPTGAVTTPNPDPFLVELSRYNAAKITGKGRENVCAMSSSSYTVTEQMESATLFAPQVYSNRQILFNAQAAKRQICSIWSLEIMLRQILMNQTNAIGADFESRKYRYLYLYPAYFFTPETNNLLHQAYSWIARTRFDAEMRKHFIAEKQVAKFNIENYQQVDELLIKENLQADDDRTFKISYPENETLTFFFLALPPGRDPTDTESWVMPAWLALTLPLLMDVKVVASESPVPPFLSGADFEQTVLLDGEHQAIRSLIQKDAYRLDGILPRKSETTNSEQRVFSPLNALTAAYCIHLEVNRKKDGDPDWGKLAALARDLETDPLYVFHYLNKWLRKQDKLDSVPIAKIRLYLELYYYFDPEGKAMNQLRELTRLYRCFYRSKSQYAKANAILKPIDEAADVILKMDKALACGNESLTDIVAARLSTLMKNVRRKAAEGKPTLALIDGKWRPALTPEEERQAVREFAKYFVEDIFEKTFKGDRARLAGRQLNLIRDTCEYLYRLSDDEERKQRQQDEPEEVPEMEPE